MTNTAAVQGLTTASIRVSLDLNLFNRLVESDRPLNIGELAEATDTDPVLLGTYFQLVSVVCCCLIRLGRLLRHQASLGIILQTAQDEFNDSQITRNLSVPDIQSGIYFW